MQGFEFIDWTLGKERQTGRPKIQPSFGCIIVIIHFYHSLLTCLSFEYTYEIISNSLIGQERFSRLPIQDIREFQARTI